jgi:hypothetical protein
LTRAIVVTVQVVVAPLQIELGSKLPQALNKGV